MAKLAEQGKLSRSPISPHSSMLLPMNPHSANMLPMPGFSSKPNSPSKTPMLPLIISRTQSPSNPCSRAQTPSRPQTSSRPLTPNSLMMRSLPTTSHGNPDRIYRRSRSRPVTPTGQITRPLLTPPGLSSTDSFSLRSTLSEVSRVTLNIKSQLFSVLLQQCSCTRRCPNMTQKQELDQNPKGNGTYTVRFTPRPSVVFYLNQPTS